MNAVQQEHPTGKLLTAYGLGQLSEKELAGIDGHLADCAVCRQVVEGVVPDTLLSLLRSAATEPDSSEGVAGVEVLRNPGDPRRGFGVPQPRPPEALTNHPRYRVGELLGIGGMGAVYKAEHLLMERPVALKVLNRELIDKPATIERFRREVRAAARLTHPNIVAAFDAEQAGDVHFLVMEYVEGVSLARHISEAGPLPVAQACDYVRQAALGLEHAHERGMVHRDIKPQNLMLTPSGQVKILDFGLARFVMESVPAGAMLGEEDAAAPLSAESQAKPLTQIGIVMGTPDYIAPEQARDSHVADIRADIYSLGCTLYDLLAGHAPFPGGSAVQKVKAHLDRTPRPVRDFRRDVPLELARIIERMMAKDPTERFQTPVEVAAALTPFLAPPKPPRRNPWPALAAAFAFIAALIAGIVIYVQTDNGTIVIETNDNKIALMIEKGDGVKIVDQANQREYVLRLSNKDVPSGEYKIVVAETLAGLEFEVNKFELKRGKEVRLTAKYVAKGKGAQPETVLSASERKRAMERLEILKEIATQKEAQYNRGTMVIDQVIAAKREVAKAELDLCESDKERVKIHERIVALAKDRLEVSEAMSQMGKIPNVDVLKAKADFLEAQNDLARATAKATTGDSVLPKQASGVEGTLYKGKPASFWLDQYKDANPTFRAEAVEALGSIAQKNKELIPVVVSALKDKNYLVARQASWSLGALGSEPVPALLEVLSDRTAPRSLERAAVAIGWIGPQAKAAVPLLREALKVNDWQARICCIYGLGHIGPDAKSAIPDMIDVYAKYLKENPSIEIPNQGMSLGFKTGYITFPWLLNEAITKIDPGADTPNFELHDRYARNSWPEYRDWLKKRYSTQTPIPSPDNALQQELARLAGTWLTIKEQRKLVTTTPRYKYVFTEQNVTRFGEEQILGDELTFKIDVSKTPKTIDFIEPARDGRNAKERLGIYELKGDTLKICVAFPDGEGDDKKRPTSFEDTEKNLGIVFLKKVKDVEPDAVSPKQESKDQGLLYRGKPASYWMGQFNDADPGFRVEAVQALGFFAKKNKEIVPLLVAYLKDEDYSISRQAAQALGYTGPEVLPVLLELLKDKASPNTIRGAAMAVSYMGPQAKAAVPLLGEALKMDDWQVRKSVLIALESIGPEAKQALPAMINSLPGFIEAVNHFRSKEGKNDEKTLGDYGFIFGTALLKIDPEIQKLVPQIELSRMTIYRWQEVYDALKTKYPPQTPGWTPFFRQKSVLQLELARLTGSWLTTKEQEKGKTSFPATKYVFGEGWVAVISGKENLTNKMTFKIDPSKTPKTIDFLFPAPPGKKGSTLLGIYELKDDTLKLCMGIGDEKGGNEKRPTTFEDTEKSLIIVFLKKVKDVEPDADSPKKTSKDQGPLFAGKPASFWLTQLQDANPKYRVEAVNALASIAQKNKELIPTLVAALKDKDSDVEYEASKGLGALGREAIPALLEVLKNEKSPTAVGYAAYALGIIGPEAKAAVPLLIQVLKRDKEPTRHDAIYALGRIGPDAKPAIPLIIEALGYYLKSLKLDEARLKQIGGGFVEWLEHDLGEGSVAAQITKSLSEIDPAIQVNLPKGNNLDPSPEAYYQERLSQWQKAYETLRTKYQK